MKGRCTCTGRCISSFSMWSIRDNACFQRGSLVPSFCGIVFGRTTTDKRRFAHPVASCAFCGCMCTPNGVARVLGLWSTLMCVKVLVSIPGSRTYFSYISRGNAENAQHPSQLVLNDTSERIAVAPASKPTPKLASMSNTKKAHLPTADNARVVNHDWLSVSPEGGPSSTPSAMPIALQLTVLANSSLTSSDATGST